MKALSMRPRRGVIALALACAPYVMSAHGALPVADVPAEFVTGGVAKEDADYLRAHAASYPLEITFSKSTSAGNAFAADVQVTVRDAQGNTVLSVPSAEPILLARLAPGRYRIDATHEGRTRTAEVTLGTGHQKIGFTW